jgi:hypothetical protein
MGLNGLISMRKYDAAMLDDGSSLPVSFALPRRWNTAAVELETNQIAQKSCRENIANCKVLLAQTLYANNEWTS